MRVVITLLGMALCFLPARAYRRLVEWARSRRAGVVPTLRLAGVLFEESGWSSPLPGSGARKMVLFPILQVLRDAAQDPSVAAISVTIGRLEAGWAQLDELRAAVLDFRRTGRPAFVYLERPGHAEYFLATAFSRIALAPVTALHLVGLRAEVSFLKGSLDLLGVTPHFEAAGDYKSAAEVFTRDDMSAEHREALDHVLSAVHGALVSAIAGGRELPADGVQALVDRGPYTADEARAAGLVDAVVYPRAWKQAIRSELGDDAGRGSDAASTEPSGAAGAEPDGGDPEPRDGDRGAWLAEVGRGIRAVTGPRQRLVFLEAGEFLRPWARLRWLERYGMPRPRVAVVVASGGIIDSDHAVVRPGRIAYRPMASLLRSLRKDGRVDAVVLRVESPGGSVLCSDMLWDELRRLREAKPLVASMGSVAASGGYYLAMAADHIVASELSITGSIGVIAGKMDVSGLLARLGITQDLLSYGAHSGIDSASAGLTDSERARVKEHIEVLYRSFVEKAALGRHREADELEPHARGRIWTGAQALDKGLVDSLGTTWDAVCEAARRAAVGPIWETWVYEPPRPGLVERLNSAGVGGGMAAVVRDLAASVSEPLSARSGEWQILARLPFRIRIY